MQLYHGLNSHFLPSSGGMAHQNPLLIAAFGRLGAIDAEKARDK